jgi:dihydroflavonol-4-reductase
MKILLLGATGLLGSAILRTNPGYKIRAVSRKPNTRSYIQSIASDKKIEIFHGDILNLSNEAFKGIDVIINAAANASARKADHLSMKRVNQDAVEDLIKKVKSHEISHFIQVSTTRTLHGITKDDDYTITEECEGSPTKDLYAKSKYAADQLLKNSKIKHSIVYPGYMLGEYDAKPSSGSILLALKYGMFTGYLNCYKNFIHPKDVADGIWKIIKNRSESNYILGNQNILIKFFLEIACNKLKCPLPKEYTRQDFVNLAKKEPFLGQFCYSYSVSNKKAVTELSFHPKISIEEMLDKSVYYFKEKGLI